ncbi:hypothetical protein AJ80_05689 [Polytolypa hystricis UAMH7299]|uniref:Peptidase C45 hydrolase domain-containing protein n=1 Tax=Polytolypa hystricis (strain UAMH7299) TaxID=1447883 RepID=A0A2B7XTH3_POLH7|nr:hypothetical protein AJ80_05689 [Polytolypa hystricis UAMH7299]
MRSISCEGTTSYEIGLQHGEQARDEIHGSLGFYRGLFKHDCSMTWEQVCQTAVKFVPFLETEFPRFVQEIRGIAQGANVDVESILALNVRTEIAYGMFNDGCTALSWKHVDDSYLAQNWDWNAKQAPNLISLHIRQPNPDTTTSSTTKPHIHMITEAGIIGKIGLNSHGVGVTLNAIKSAGVEFNKLPCHLALRAALESPSRSDAVEMLCKYGVASACHILVADETGGTGLECSANDIVQLHMGDEGVEPVPGVVTHTNHFVHKHSGGAESILYLPDSVPRLARIRELVAACTSGPSLETVGDMLKDEQGYPTAICRVATEKYPTETLFSIMMDLVARKARVKIGRPVEPEEAFELSP